MKTPMIAIVDDNEAVRTTRALVRSLGYNASTFSSAEEFLDSNPGDTSCLILDVQMKGLSGVELQEFLDRARPAHADHFSNTRSKVLAAGAIGFLSKPCSDEKLTKFLDMAIANESPE